MVEAWTGYRRHISIVPAAGHIAVDMEDDHHHFGVSIFHDGEIITKVEPRTIRYPWTSCFDAGVLLVKRMEGMSLSKAAAAEDQRQHCTHLFDLFIVGLSHYRDSAPSEYQITVRDDIGGVKKAEIRYDDALLLQWNLTDAAMGDDGITGDFNAFNKWTRTLPDHLEEAGRMFRRGVLVSRGRGMEFRNGFSILEEVPNMTGACYSFQPENAENAIAIGGTTRDFSANPQDLLTEKP